MTAPRATSRPVFRDSLSPSLVELLDVAAPPSSMDDALQHAIDIKTKPPGSLGVLERVARQVGRIQRSVMPELARPAMLVFAGDHGVVAAGVSPYPQAVTAQMVLNFLRGGAAINVFCRTHGIELEVVNAGVAADFPAHASLVDIPVARGTQNFLEAPAMTHEQVETALSAGAARVVLHASRGTRMIGFGEMGIGNTSSAACLMQRLTGLPLAACVGRGTGLDAAGLTRKTQVLERALAAHPATGERVDALQTLATFGGFEIAMMTGAYLAAAKLGLVIVVDGFISTSALLVASRLAPAVLDYCVFAHASDETGHRAMLDALNAKPLLQLGLRLGEGTGAALAMPLIQAAAAFLREMATFEGAGVSDREVPAP
ncbi:nicotinate-nucleotide--dimethylbenzimidazole phosphoribosyltransferase [Pandoraea pulmonicola]|uniref:Nicotinate-nucleotide--dimethylbenzimidazole phosphoribosyltransferase n=2 Tax=Pandoraea pulmonicola TaxID=93221 RepID=A0AAJ5CZL2_PANPU|nr:nicotinate-nucleotide--dimethylbenzimidazole phosphoribosyltransferase [Pandoraea pulmonicola]SUA89723.1 Nicotinate-nucleotide--dimethylbenzimidazole phosphoribosyltransferase [Pandoraea pulmonicola]